MEHLFKESTGTVGINHVTNNAEQQALCDHREAVDTFRQELGEQTIVTGKEGVDVKITTEKEHVYVMSEEKFYELMKHLDNHYSLLANLSLGGPTSDDVAKGLFSVEKEVDKELAKRYEKENRDESHR